MLFSHCRVTVRTSTRAHMFYIVNVSFLRIVYRVKKNNVFRVRVSVALSCHTCHTCTSNVCTTFERHTRVRVVWRVHVGFRKRVTVFDYCVIFCQLEVTTRRNFQFTFFLSFTSITCWYKKERKNFVYRRFPNSGQIFWQERWETVKMKNRVPLTLFFFRNTCTGNQCR